MQKKERFARRLQRLRQQLQKHKLDAVHFTQQKNISWLTGGRSHVNTASEPACSQWIISAEECVMISNNIEQARLLEEEIGFRDAKLITDVEVWPWHDPTKLAELTSARLRGYRSVQNDAQAEPWLLHLRTVFEEQDIPLLKEAGRHTSEALEQTAMKLRRGNTEYEIAGLLAAECWARGLEPIVNLIAVDERVLARRHPLPTNKRLEQTAMLVVCARRDGYIISATRMVHFGALSAEQEQKFTAVTNIDAHIIGASRPGRSGGELYEILRKQYEHNGYPDEFAHHHQGGLTGYVTRERLAVKHADWKVTAGQMLAWNPSIAGVKSEDTILVREGGNIVLTPVLEFPEVTTEDKLTRPGILLRK
jgi:Xaa-Pro aminopeptidase